MTLCKIFLICCSQIVYTADDNLLQTTGWVNNTPHTSHFLVFLCTHNSVAHDIGSRCVAHVIPSMSHAHRVVVLILFDSPLCTLHSLSHLLLHPPDLHLHIPCGSVRREVPCALPRKPDSFVYNATLTSYGARNQELGQNCVFTSIGKQVRDRVHNSAMDSQERQRHDNPFSSIGKPVRRGVCERSSTGETCAVDREPTCNEEVGLPQYANLRQLVFLRTSSRTFDRMNRY